MGKNKKMAKRHAANLMIKKLGEVPVDSEGTPESIDDDDLVEGESDDSDADIKEADRISKKPSKRFSQLHKNLKCYKVGIFSCDSSSRRALVPLFVRSFVRNLFVSIKLTNMLTC